MQHLALLAATLGFAAAPAAADVKFDLTYSNYEVRGLTEQAIDADIERQGSSHSGGAADAETTHDVDWSFKFAISGSDCRVVSDEVMLKVDILLPSWVDASRASPHLQTAWNRYFAEVKAHEERHKDISLAAANKIDRLAHGLAAPGSCASLEKTLNRAAEEVLAEEEQLQAQVDAEHTPTQID